MRRILKTWIEFVDENNLHIALAVIGVAVAIVAHVLGELDIEGLVDVTLVLLVVITVGLVFDRKARKRAEDAVDEFAASLGSAIERAVSDVTALIETLSDQVGRLQQFDHYKVISSESTWDITDGGAIATSTKVRRLRFLRDRMVTVTDYYGVDEGEASEPVVAAPFRFAGMVRDGATSFDHILVALDRMYNTDQEIETTVQRTLSGSFLARQQEVNCRVQDETSRLAMKVIWPADRELADVRLEYALDQLHVDLRDKLETTDDGRKYYEHVTFPPKRGDVVTIRWRWAI